MAQHMQRNVETGAPRLIDCTALVPVAEASSYGANNNIRWTELGIYYRPGERRPFVAQSIGRSKVLGETDFVRQRVGKSIDEVSRLFDNSRLADDVAAQAQAWLDRHPEAVGTPPPRIQFNGAGGLRGALLWLYPTSSKDSSDNVLAKQFQNDWGVPVRTVTHALAQERDGEGLPSWCKAFMGALQHFDRDAFHAARRV